MTNAEKYLKDGVNIDELTFKFDDWHFKNSDVIGYGEALFRFLQAEVQPTLTEDERVILRNIEHPYKWIRRNHLGNLQISDKEDCAGLKWYINFTCYQNLFLFIKKREEYSIEELLK